MDLALLDTSKKSSEGAVMYLRHPGDGSILEHDKDGESTKFFVKLLGRDSKQFMQTLKDSQSFKDGENEEAVSAAAITVDGLVFIDGKWITLNSDNAADIYTRLNWILEQVTVFVFDRKNFFPDQNQS